jgi:hypothetical protein
MPEDGGDVAVTVEGRGVLVRVACGCVSVAIGDGGAEQAPNNKTASKALIVKEGRLILTSGIKNLQIFN